MSKAKQLLETFFEDEDQLSVGTRIRVKGEGHGTGKTGKIGRVATEPVYAVYLDEAPNKLHKWYAQSEIEEI